MSRTWQAWMRFIGRQSAKALQRGLFSRLPLFQMGKRWKSIALPLQTRFTEKRFGQQAGREARTWIRLQSGQVKSCTCRRREVGIHSPGDRRLTFPEKSGKLSKM